jgi:cholesterol transport system auxiliary component
MTRPSHVSITRRGLIATGATSLLVAGCGGALLGPSTPPLQLYLLKPALGPLPDAPNVSWQLGVARPNASQSLDGERIALERSETMDFYADAQWTDSAPRLVQSLLVEAFEKSGKIGAVAREAEGMHADYILQTEIRDFAAHYDSENGAPDVVVTIVCKLFSSHGEVIATLSASHDSRAGQNSIPSVVEAFNQALGGVLEELVAWALRAPQSSSAVLSPSHHTRQP